MRRLAVVFCILGLMGAAAGGSFPDSPEGKRAQAYFEAFNSGEEQMKAFFLENITEEGLQKRSISQRLDFYHQLHSDAGSLNIQKIVESRPHSLEVSAQGEKNLWVTIQFDFQEVAPHKIAAMQVEVNDAPPSAAVEREPKKKSDSEVVSSLDAYLSELARKDEFSGVVLLAKDGAPFFQKAYGYASREFQVANRIDTKFNLGSINKLFTQIAIFQLIEQGKLSLEDTLIKHFPDYPNRQVAEKVKIKHLLDMRSGIGDFFGEKFDRTPKDRFRKLSDFLFTFADEPLQFEPGTQNRYSNGGYIILGLVIEKVSGQNYFDYVRENIFKPAGMVNTDSYEADEIIPNLASGYTRAECNGANCARRSNIYTRPAKGSSAGGGYSTAADLLKLASALQSGKILSRTNSDQILGRGYAGGADGINALFEPAYKQNYTIIVLVNEDPPLAESIGKIVNTWLP